MTTLNFLLTRALGRELERGRRDRRARGSTTTRTSRRGSSSRTTSASSSASSTCTTTSTLDLDDLEAQLTDRTRVVAFPVASNAVGTMPDVARIVELAHGAGALAWADAVHYGPHGPIDVAGWDVDVLLCSPYKFFGPHMGIAFGKRELLESAGARTRCARPPTSRSATASSTGRSSTSCSPASSPRSSTSSRSAGRRSSATSAQLGAAVPRRAAGGGGALRAADDGGTRADVRVQARRAARAEEVATSSRRAGSPSGTATTTRSRS